jgi:hypothetical protein
MLIPKVLSFMPLWTFATPLPSSGTAVQLAERDIFDQTIRQVIDNVISGLSQLTWSVRAFDGNVSNSIPILDASSSLLNSIQVGTVLVRNADVLSLIQTLEALPATFGLNDAVKGAVDALIAKKPVFDSSGLTAVVLQQLQGQQAASQSLVDVLLNKLPRYLPSSIGETLSNPILKELSTAVQVFSIPATAGAVAVASAPSNA